MLGPLTVGTVLVLVFVALEVLRRPYFEEALGEGRRRKMGGGSPRQIYRVVCSWLASKSSLQESLAATRVQTRS